VSVVHYFSIAPGDCGPAEAPRFAALLDDLLDTGPATTPVSVASGQAGHNPGAFRLGTAALRHSRQDSVLPPRASDDDLDLTVRYAGGDRQAIRSAVFGAPFATADVCAYFPVRRDDPDRTRACDGALFSVREPVTLFREYSLVVTAGGNLFDYDPGDPADLFADRTWRGTMRPTRTYPVSPATGYITHQARWFVSLDGGYAWDFAVAILEICARHLGEQHFVGYHAA
jgi:hypothetical protein